MAAQPLNQKPQANQPPADVAVDVAKQPTSPLDKILPSDTAAAQQTQVQLDGTTFILDEGALPVAVVTLDGVRIQFTETYLAVTKDEISTLDELCKRRTGLARK